MKDQVNIIAFAIYATQPKIVLLIVPGKVPQQYAHIVRSGYPASLSQPAYLFIGGDRVSHIMRRVRRVALLSAGVSDSSAVQFYPD